MIYGARISKGIFKNILKNFSETWKLNENFTYQNL